MDHRANKARHEAQLAAAGEPAKPRGDAPGAPVAAE
jgi:hypothetical protein